MKDMTLKKFLFATSALVATGIASPAFAAEKISLSVGGFMEQWVGYADNNNARSNSVGGTATNAALSERNEVDVQSDSEIHFTGATKLDNGLTIAVLVEMEADAAGIDKSNLTVSGGFGQIILGGEDNVGAIIHSMAPEVGIGNADGDAGNWIAAPAAITGVAATNNPTFENGDGVANKIVYITPTLAGFQAGASYTPSTNGGNNTLEEAGRDVFVGGIAYNNAFGDVAVKADIGAFSLNGAGPTNASGSAHGYQGGLNLTYAGFTLGGSMLWKDDGRRDNGEAILNDQTTSASGVVWDAGLAYETGPYAVSLNYSRSRAEGSVLFAGDDTIEVLMLSGAYTMGPGVALKGSLFQVDYEDETNLAANENGGWGLVTGLALDF